MSIFDDRDITHDKLIELGFDKSCSCYILKRTIEYRKAYILIYLYRDRNVIRKVFDSVYGRLVREYKLDKNSDIDDIILHMDRMEYNYDVKLHKWVIE